MSRKYTSLRFKLLVTNIAIILTLGVLIITLIKTVYSKHLLNQLQKRGLYITNHLAKEVIDGILIRDNLILDALIVDALEGNNDIEYIFVLNEREEVLAHTFENGFPIDLKKVGIIGESKKVKGETISISGKLVYNIAMPILSGEIGMISIGFLKEPILKDVNYMIGMIIGILITMLIVAAICICTFSNLIVKPILTLTKAVELIGSGEQTDKIQVKSNDEIGELASAFNQMVKDLVESHKALVNAKNYTEDIITNLSDALIVVDSEDKVVTINPATAELLGYNENEFSGKPLATIFAEENIFDGRKLKEIVEKKEVRNYELNCKAKDGRKIPVLFSAGLIKDSGGNITRIVCVVKDISELKQAQVERKNAYQKLEQTQHELIQSNKMAVMGQLTAGISHELNQPLTGIKGFAQAGMMDMQEDNPLRDDLNMIVTQADRMDKIIQNVRLFGRKSEIKMKEININKPLEDSLMLLTEQFRVHSISLKKSLAEDLPKIQGDSNQLQQIFINLIINARDAIDSLNNPDGGTLSIKTALTEDKQDIEIIFEDTGCGIPKEQLEHIFNPFFTTKSPNGGMGLGLSIVYRIIENHKGKIEVESEEGKGTTFKITLPVISRV